MHLRFAYLILTSHIWGIEKTQTIKTKIMATQKEYKENYINQRMNEGASIGRAVSDWTNEGKGEYYQNEFFKGSSNDNFESSYPYDEADVESDH